MKSTIIVDVSSIYHGLGSKRLSYKKLISFCEHDTTVTRKVAIIVSDPNKGNRRFVDALAIMGFEINFVPNKTTAQFETITEARKAIEEDPESLVFLCTNATCPLYTCKGDAKNIFVIGTDIDVEFRKLYRSIEIPPSMLT